jgi:hypothetical protein
MNSKNKRIISNKIFEKMKAFNGKDPTTDSQYDQT